MVLPYEKFKEGKIQILFQIFPFWISLSGESENIKNTYGVLYIIFIHSLSTLTFQI